MNRLARNLKTLQKKQETAAVFFITAGDPSLEETLEIMKALADNGADVIELGVPFSDPTADGPIIQASTTRALKNGVNIPAIFKLVQEFRKERNTPIVLMGYFNPIMRYGCEAFVTDCRTYGIDGLIIADLPYEEAETMEQLSLDHEISLIYLLAPDIDPQRTAAIAKASTGFIYCVSQYNTTGTVDAAPDQHLADTLATLRKQTDTPLAVGFGISSLERVREIGKIADGVIIGSWLIQELENTTQKAAKAGKFAQQVKSALMA